MSDFPITPPRFSATFTPAVNAEIRRAELVALGLRTREGIDAGILDRTKTRQLESGGLIFLAEGRAMLTRHGRLLADEIAVELA